MAHTDRSISMHLAHIALWTRDLDVAAAFWREYFGAAIGEPYYSQRRRGFVSRFVTLPDGKIKIELMSAPGLANPPSNDALGWGHIAISLGSPSAVDQLASRAAAAGLLLSPPRTTGDGFYEAVLATPDGAPIEITA
jgi:lactoylglutathione lyase